jgi:hypothetical protein
MTDVGGTKTPAINLAVCLLDRNELVALLDEFFERGSILVHLAAGEWVDHLQRLLGSLSLGKLDIFQFDTFLGKSLFDLLNGLAFGCGRDVSHIY